MNGTSGDRLRLRMLLARSSITCVFHADAPSGSSPGPWASARAAVSGLAALSSIIVRVYAGPAIIYILARQHFITALQV